MADGRAEERREGSGYLDKRKTPANADVLLVTFFISVCHILADLRENNEPDTPCHAECGKERISELE